MDEPCFIYKRRVFFADTDASGVAHFSRLLCIVEEAEHQALRSVGIAVLSRDCGWPRVHLDINYRSSGALNEELSVCIKPCKIGVSSLEWVVEVSCGTRLVLDGAYTVVRVGSGGGKMPIPLNERKNLELLM
ncbi:MAG: hotdog domain-containing protein [Akkermansia sp.]